MFTVKMKLLAYVGKAHDDSDLEIQPGGLIQTIIVLTVATALVAPMREMLVGALDQAAETFPVRSSSGHDFDASYRFRGDGQAPALDGKGCWWVFTRC